MSPVRPPQLARAAEVLAGSCAEALRPFHGQRDAVLECIRQICDSPMLIAQLGEDPPILVPSRDLDPSPLLRATSRLTRPAIWRAGGPATAARALDATGFRMALVLPLERETRRGVILVLDPAEREDLATLGKALVRVAPQVLPETHSPAQEDLERKLARSEERSRLFFECGSDAIFIQDCETGALLDVNQRMCEMYGYSREEALGLDVGALSVGLSPCSMDEALAWMRKAAEGEPQTFEWLARHKSGRLFWIELFLTRATLDGQPRLLATARDISERKRQDSEQAARLRRAEAQNAIFLALAGVGADAHAAHGIIAHHLAAQVGDLCILHRREADQLVPSAMEQSYIDGAPLLPSLRALPPMPSGWAEAAPRRLTDPGGRQLRAQFPEAFHPYLKRYSIHSLLVVPMRSQGRTIGTITLAKGGSSRPYSVEDQAMLQNLADRAALAITNAQLNVENLEQAERLRRANAELERRVEERTAELAHANARLQRMAIEDALTGLANRRRFNEVMEGELRRARRSGGRVALLLCDVDFFKRYNDHYGHQAGDRCLATVGEVLRKVFRRAGELPARYGGEEFAVILPGSTAEQARQAAEKLRQALAARGLPHALSEAAPHVSLSIGVASAVVDATTDMAWFVSRADAGMYASKAEGRNRVTVVAEGLPG